MEQWMAFQDAGAGTKLAASILAAHCTGTVESMAGVE